MSQTTGGAGVVGAKEPAIVRFHDREDARLSAPDTLMQIFPSSDLGMPGAREMSVHIEPPSVDLKTPLRGPPLESTHGFLQTSHKEA
jgi:hypothetical protein